MTFQASVAIRHVELVEGRFKPNNIWETIKYSTLSREYVRWHKEYAGKGLSGSFVGHNASVHRELHFLRGLSRHKWRWLHVNIDKRSG